MNNVSRGEMDNTGSVDSMLTKRFQLNKHRTLVRVTLRGKNVDIHDLTPLISTLQAREGVYNLQKLRELHQAFRDEAVHVLERPASPDSNQRGILRLHGRMKDEVDALPPEAVEVSEEGRQMDVGVESDEDHVAWRVNDLAIETFLMNLITERENDLAKNANATKATSSKDGRPRVRQPIDLSAGGTTKSQTRERGRHHNDERSIEDAVVAAARHHQAAIRDDERETVEKEDQQDSIRKSRELRRDAQGLGLGNPIKKAEDSEGAVEKIQKNIDE